MNRLKIFTKIFQHYKEPPKVRININSKNSKLLKNNTDINDPNFSKNFWKQFKN